MKISNELKIGFWAIVAVLVFFFGANYLKGIKSFSKGQTFYLTCQKVNGLDVSSHITLHGLKVGMVRDLNYDPQGDYIVVKLDIYDSEMLLPRDSRVSVSTDLLGTSEVTLELGKSRECYTPGDTIAAYVGKPGLMEQADPILEQVSQLMPKIDTLVSGINVLVNESKLHESLLQVNTLTQHLNTTVLELNRMLRQDVPALMGNLESVTANFDTVAVQLKEADIRQLLGTTQATIENANQLLTQLQADDSSVGKLIKTEELHDQLVKTIADMDALLNDIKENPKRYIHIKVF